jgi:ribonuclease HII
MPCVAFILGLRMAFDPELIPLVPDLSFEMALWQVGLTFVAGIDEAGRGALAGPVVAAAVVLPADPQIFTKLQGVRDSKQMTADQREEGRARIIKHAVTWGVGFATVEDIDQWGILPATRLAATRAIEALEATPVHLLLDYLFLPEVSVSQTALIKGDRRSLSIAAASVLAKTNRDAMMRDLDQSFPGYGFARHKGYGTAAHRNALYRLGVSSAHRRSFDLLGKNKPQGDEATLDLSVVHSNLA